MTNPPEASGSFASRGLILLLLVLLGGAGIYLLGRRSTSVPPEAPQKAAETGPTANEDAPLKSSERHLAPHDTFFLLEYVSAKTSTGVIGFEPGQEVHLVEVRPESQKLVVGDGKAQVEVSPDKLTNDLDIASLVRKKDQANQTKIAAYLEGERKAYDDAQRDAAAKFEKAAEKLNREQQDAAAKVANNQPKRESGSDQPNAVPVGSGTTKLDEPPVSVGGASGYGGYGYAGSAYYGSPYSYFGGSTSVGTAPVTSAPAGTAVNPASVGALAAGKDGRPDIRAVSARGR